MREILSTCAALLALSIGQQSPDEQSLKKDSKSQGVAFWKSNSIDLPPVDRVTIVILGGAYPTLPKNSYTNASGRALLKLGQRTVNKFDAEQIASRWRLLGPRTDAHLCHDPPYALRFEHDDEVLFEATICWECTNICYRAKSGEAGYFNFELDGDAKALLNLLRKMAPNSVLERHLSSADGQ